MSTHVVGFRPPDEKWRRMKAVWDACRAADVRMPDDVVLFFEGQEPSDAGVVVEIPKRPWSIASSAGFEVDIETLPKGVKVLRFYNSW